MKIDDGVDSIQAKGRDAIALLACRFPQLYVVPAEGVEAANRLAAGRGIAPSQARLDHFLTSDDDELRVVETPAGPIEVLFLKERADFETFLQIVGHRSEPVPIAPTVGAITYRGLPDWGAVADARMSYLAAGGTDWGSEFSRLAAKPGAFRAELIVISQGPYSNVVSTDAGYPDDEWLRVSREIRLHHECAHVVCRRLMPDDILPVWDEVTADVTGLLCATGRYDAALAARFLGVDADGYRGGRLVEYLEEKERQNPDTIAAEVYASLVRIETMATEAAAAEPFAFLLELKRSPLLAY